MKEKFCQKLIVSKVILALLDNLKPKIFFVGQPVISASDVKRLSQWDIS